MIHNDNSLITHLSLQNIYIRRHTTHILCVDMKNVIDFQLTPHERVYDGDSLVYDDDDDECV